MTALLAAWPIWLGLFCGALLLGGAVTALAWKAFQCLREIGPFLDEMDNFSESDGGGDGSHG